MVIFYQNLAKTWKKCNKGRFWPALGVCSTQTQCRNIQHCGLFFFCIFNLLNYKFREKITFYKMVLLRGKTWNFWTPLFEVGIVSISALDLLAVWDCESIWLKFSFNFLNAQQLFFIKGHNGFLFNTTWTLLSKCYRSNIYYKDVITIIVMMCHRKKCVHV